MSVCLLENFICNVGWVKVAKCISLNRLVVCLLDECWEFELQIEQSSDVGWSDGQSWSEAVWPVMTRRASGLSELSQKAGLSRSFSPDSGRSDFRVTVWCPETRTSWRASSSPAGRSDGTRDCEPSTRSSVCPSAADTGHRHKHTGQLHSERSQRIWTDCWKDCGGADEKSGSCSSCRVRYIRKLCCCLIAVVFWRISSKALLRL